MQQLAHSHSVPLIIVSCSEVKLPTWVLFDALHLKAAVAIRPVLHNLLEGRYCTGDHSQVKDVPLLLRMLETERGPSGPPSHTSFG